MTGASARADRAAHEPSLKSRPFGEHPLRYLSVCSGIEAATVAWHPLGWVPAAFSEIEAFPRAVLKHHYPDVPCHGDFTTIEDEYGPVDLLVGGTPCQSFSVAGLRGGLADERGNLALEYLRLADRLRPRWLVWENVPGVFSSLSHDAPDPCPPEIDLDADNAPQDGEEVVVEDSYDSDESHALACFLAGLSELGYGWAYRVLDAQYAGVPQRRRRVFVVGHLGDWRRAAAVLFERHSLQGNPAPRRETGPSVAALTATGVGTCGADDNQGQAGHLIPDKHYGGDRVFPTLDTRMDQKFGCNQWVDSGQFVMEQVAHSLRAEGFDASEDGSGRGTPLVPVCFGADDYKSGSFASVDVSSPITTSADRTRAAPIAFTAKDHGADASDISPTLRSGSHSGSHANGGVMPAVAFQSSQSGVREVEAHATLDSNNGSRRHNGVIQGSAVRRLTPRECERLQGFPDDYTLVPYRGKPAADGPRYKALGNSMAVPVMRWIGERIALVDAIAMAPDRAANADLPVPQDCQARPEGIAQC